MRVAIDANTILSGLFFQGNERRLLVESLRRRVTLVYAEDIVEEVYAVIAETFREHPNLSEALELLEDVFSGGELIPRPKYAKEVERWAPLLRDSTDAPLFACADATGADGVVSGDEDVLALRGRVDVEIMRTAELLRKLDRRNG